MPYDPTRHHRRSIRLRGYDYTQAGAYFITICVRDRACLFGTVRGGMMRLSALGKIVQDTWEGLPRHYPHLVLDRFVVMPNHVHGIVRLVDGHDMGGTGRVVFGDDGAGRIVFGMDDDGAGRVVFGMDDGADRVVFGMDDDGADRVVFGMDDDGADRVVGAGLKPAPTTSRPASHAGTGDASPPASHAGTGDASPPASRAGLGRATHSDVDAGRKRHGLPEIVRAFKTFSARRINEHRRTPGTPVWQRNYYEHIIRDEHDYRRIAAYIEQNPQRWAEDILRPGSVRSRRGT